MFYPSVLPYIVETKYIVETYSIHSRNKICGCWKKKEVTLLKHHESSFDLGSRGTPIFCEELRSPLTSPTYALSIPGSSSYTFFHERYRWSSACLLFLLLFLYFQSAVSDMGKSGIKIFVKLPQVSGVFCCTLCLGDQLEFVCKSLTFQKNIGWFFSQLGTLT